MKTLTLTMLTDILDRESLVVISKDRLKELENNSENWLLYQRNRNNNNYPVNIIKCYHAECNAKYVVTKSIHEYINCNNMFSCFIDKCISEKGKWYCDKHVLEYLEEYGYNQNMFVCAYCHYYYNHEDEIQ